MGLVGPSCRPKSGSKSKISGRIRKNVRGLFSSAELRGEVRQRCAAAVCRGAAALAAAARRAASGRGVGAAAGRLRSVRVTLKVPTILKVTQKSFRA